MRGGLTGCRFIPSATTRACNNHCKPTTGLKRPFSGNRHEFKARIRSRRLFLHPLQNLTDNAPCRLRMEGSRDVQRRGGDGVERESSSECCRSRRAKEESDPGILGMNTRDLHAGGAANGRGLKRRPCPRPLTKRSRGRRMLRFPCLPVGLGNQHRQPTQGHPASPALLHEGQLIRTARKGNSGRHHRRRKPA